MVQQSLLTKFSRSFASFEALISEIKSCQFSFHKMVFIQTLTVEIVPANFKLKVLKRKEYQKKEKTKMYEVITITVVKALAIFILIAT